MIVLFRSIILVTIDILFPWLDFFAVHEKANDSWILDQQVETRELGSNVACARFAEGHQLLSNHPRRFTYCVVITDYTLDIALRNLLLEPSVSIATFSFTQPYTSSYCGASLLRKYSPSSSRKVRCDHIGTHSDWQWSNGTSFQDQMEESTCGTQSSSKTSWHREVTPSWNIASQVQIVWHLFSRYVIKLKQLFP